MIPRDLLAITLSDLVLMYVEDLEWAEASPIYLIDMDAWHMPRSHFSCGNRRERALAKEQHKSLDDVLCKVCPVGAIMARRFNTPPTANTWPRNLDEAVANLLVGLDDICDGDVEDAAKTWKLGKDTAKELFRRLNGIDIVSYHDDPIAFKQAMCDAAAELREMGL